MGHDVRIGGRRLFHRGAQLVERVLGMRDRRRRRRDAAGSHDLDLGGAAAQFVAHGSAHVVDASRRRGKRIRRAGNTGRARRIRYPSAIIAMPSGLAQRAAGDEQPRPLDEPALQRQRQAVIGAPGVARRREAAIEHAFEDGNRVQRDQRVRHLLVSAKIDRRGDHVDVGVDQSGHQHAISHVDDARIASRQWSVRNLDDLRVFDQHVMVGRGHVLVEIDERASLEQRLHSGFNRK